MIMVENSWSVYTDSNNGSHGDQDVGDLGKTKDGKASAKPFENLGYQVRMIWRIIGEAGRYRIRGRRFSSKRRAN